jgi:hypothetical protein
MQEFVASADKMLIIFSSNFSARNDKYGIVCQSYFNVHSRVTVMQHKTSKSVGLQGKRQTSRVSPVERVKSGTGCYMLECLRLVCDPVDGPPSRRMC